MLESLKHEDLQFQELSPEEKQSRGILARLSGPIASFTKGTRNGRKYSDKLWEKAFDSPLVKEMFKNGGLPGELQHPENRSETDPTKIAIMMPEPPKKDSNGHLVASVDILDTPCGQIAYQLGKYGFKFGISSRGEGDLITDFSGEESVDPDTYTLNAFDLVLIPACEDARLQFNESLERKSSTNNLRSILSEALEKASDKDRKIMEDAIDELDFSNVYEYVETYEDNDIFYDPDTKKYIVGDTDSYTTLNSLKNAKEYIDRYNPNGQFFNEGKLNEEVFYLEYTYDTYDDTLDRADNNLRGHINVKANSEKEAIEKAKKYLANSNKLNVRHFQTTNDRYTNVDLLETQVGREETKESEKPSDILQNKPQEEQAVDSEGNIITLEENSEEEEDELLDEALTPQEKMDAWHEGKRRENIKACGDRKLASYINICKNKGYDKEVGLIRQEFKRRGVPQELYEEVDIEDNEEDTASWNTDFHKLDVAYNHNFKQFEDMEEDKDALNDFIEDLDNQHKKYTVYKHEKDPGCTVFFKESLNEDISWEELNGTEQSAVEAALAELKNGSTIEDAVHGAVEMYNNANEDEEYKDEDFFMEEADYIKVLDYVKSHEGIDESLNEARMGMFSYTYGVHAHPSGEDRILAGSRDLDSITKSGIEQAQKIFENPWMTDKEKYDYLETMYISNDDTEELDVSPEFDDYVDGLMSELSTRLDKSSSPKQLYELKEDKYTRDELFDKFGTDNLDIINAGNEETVEFADDNDVAIVEQLQNILKQNKSLEEKVKTLQEKLSVGYAKEMELREELDTYKQRVSKLSNKTKEIKVLTEKLSKAEQKIKDNNAQAEGKISTLNESISNKDFENKDLRKDISVLTETLGKKDSLIKSLDEQLGKYKEKLSSKQDDIEQLKEQYETGQKDLEQLKTQYANKIEQQNQIIEKYQRVAKNSVKRYIESQAVRLGVKSDEIVNRLPKNYSFNDIDIICEDLQEYKFNISNLPFSQYGLNENLKVTAKNVSKGLIEANPDDEITEYDLKIAEAYI